MAIPCLRYNKRLQHGFQDRVIQNLPPKADLWIQAASVGEAFLACEILQNMQPVYPVKILLTTYTLQGMKILQSCFNETSPEPDNMTVFTSYFPFDKPSIMAKALHCIQPKLIVLLESELWPGLLSHSLKEKAKVLVVNGRMTEKSLSRYNIWPTLWKSLRPTKILAMSEEDCCRFSTLFGKDIVELMHNIKFDRLEPVDTLEKSNNPLLSIIKPNRHFVVLGSVRQEEETEITSILSNITNRNSDLIIGLFPRHMHRLNFWKKTLAEKSLPWKLRSEITTPVKEGCIVLWDTMGELSHAYSLANAAFVGGSLAPVGGQNFLEPLTFGLRPVIGPHWSNFYWIGKEIIEQKLVLQVNTWQDVSQLLLANSTNNITREETRKAVREYLHSRKGGTQKACEAITGYLSP